MLITQLHLRPTEVREAAAPPPNYKFQTQMRLINKYETSMGANDTIAGSRKGVGVPQRLGKKSIFKWAQKKGLKYQGAAGGKTRVLRTPKVLTPEQGP